MWSKPAGSATAAQVLSQLALSVMFLISLYKIARFHNGVVQSLTLTAGGASAAFSAQSASEPGGDTCLCGIWNIAACAGAKAHIPRNAINTVL